MKNSISGCPRDGGGGEVRRGRGQGEILRGLLKYKESSIS